MQKGFRSCVAAATHTSAEDVGARTGGCRQTGGVGGGGKGGGGQSWYVDRNVEDVDVVDGDVQRLVAVCGAAVVSHTYPCSLPPLSFIVTPYTPPPHLPTHACTHTHSLVLSLALP